VVVVLGALVAVEMEVLHRKAQLLVVQILEAVVAVLTILVTLTLVQVLLLFAIQPHTLMPQV
jgi:hypothetical protein